MKEKKSRIGTIMDFEGLSLSIIKYTFLFLKMWNNPIWVALRSERNDFKPGPINIQAVWLWANYLTSLGLFSYLLNDIITAPSPKCIDKIMHIKHLGTVPAAEGVFNTTYYYQYQNITLISEPGHNPIEMS